MLHQRRVCKTTLFNSHILLINHLGWEGVHQLELSLRVLGMCSDYVLTEIGNQTRSVDLDNDSASNEV